MVIAVIAVLVFFLFLIFYFYNTMVNLRNRTDEAFSAIDVQLKKGLI